jgi:hypothetical protein
MCLLLLRSRLGEIFACHLTMRRTLRNAAPLAGALFRYPRGVAIGSHVCTLLPSQLLKKRSPPHRWFHATQYLNCIFASGNVGSIAFTRTKPQLTFTRTGRLSRGPVPLRQSYCSPNIRRHRSTGIWVFVGHVNDGRCDSHEYWEYFCSRLLRCLHNNHAPNAPRTVHRCCDQSPGLVLSCNSHCHLN